MAAKDQYYCMTADCNAEAIKYCRNCDQLFCAQHDQMHEQLVKFLLKPHEVLTIDDYIIERGENSPFCRQHEASPLIVACINCYEPMCAKCLDQIADQATSCESSGQDKHTMYSPVELVARKIKNELDDLLSEVRVNEMTSADKIKTGRQLYDEQMESSRDDLDKLDTKIQELREILEEVRRTTKQRIVDSMNERKRLMLEWERQYGDHQKTCEEMCERVAHFKKLSKEAIVKNQSKVKDDLQIQLQFKPEDVAQPTNQLFLEVLDKPMNIPIRLSETPSNTNTPTALSNPAIPVLPIPTRLQYRELRTALNDNHCVYFTTKGQLLHTGHNYGISGLSFTPKIPTGGNTFNFSISEHNNEIYILQYQNKQYHVHKVHLSDHSVSENIIKFDGSGSWWQQLMMNDEFIIISEAIAKCVRIYSSKSSAHLFDIKHECISNWPWGVGLVGDLLVVGDTNQNQVSNMTINERPEVRWTCTGITKPAALRVVENPQMILVASYTTKQIYVLSYQGQKLSTLAVPECSTYIYDIAVYDRQIAVADGGKQIKVYEISE